MLNYTVTIAISAIFVPHYLTKFGPAADLIGHPGDIVGGAVVVALLVAILNIVGVKEAAGLNIFLALTDLAHPGAARDDRPGHGVLPASSCRRNVAPGHRADAGATSSSPIPVAMVAYTGIETVSNMAEEAIDPPRHVPRSIMYVVLAVFAIYAFLPSVALSALPVKPATPAQVADSHDPDARLRQGR